MKNLLFFLFFLIICNKTMASDIFEPVHKNTLRAPAVPLFTSDPYFSIWSPSDELYGSETVHWSDVARPFTGALRVDGHIYRFMGYKPLEIIQPMACDATWHGTYTYDEPAENWFAVDYDDGNWNKGNGAFGTYRVGMNTLWNKGEIWIRRTFEVDSIFNEKKYYLKYSHDEKFDIYINGIKIVTTNYNMESNILIELDEKIIKTFKEGKNVIAVHGIVKETEPFIDFGIYTQDDKTLAFDNTAKQTSLNVTSTQTYYSFNCGPVKLDIIFTAPLLLNDLDLLSTPINYISYKIVATDKRPHSVQIYFDMTPQMGFNDYSQKTRSRNFIKNGLNYLETGTVKQPYVERVGDLTCIDWGYAYIVGKAESSYTSIGDCNDVRYEFSTYGRVVSENNKIAKSFKIPVLAYMEDLSISDKYEKTGYVMIGYDDIYSIEYMYKRRKAYWTHDGQITIFDAFEKAVNNYSRIIERCRKYDKMIYDDAFNAGGKEYAEICALSYRQVISAHKLIKDDSGNLLYFSKENNSNGCINTVDLTYPSSPLFLLYNTDLLKAMMTSIFEYSKSGRWDKPFPAHDLGKYPVANGQLYDGDMPIEESGNMLILSAAIAKIDNSDDYFLRYWNLLTTWANYLVEYGFDPENQLCTDDFAGHWAHNANLSVKAIMGIAAYSELAKLNGFSNIASDYMRIAKEMAIKWKYIANDGTHYRLAFDRPGTWSQKYNMIWDKIWNLNLFSDDVVKKEIAYYKMKQNLYGLPLDCRETYTKSDWTMWTAAMADDTDTFKYFITPLYKFINETPSRVPISDWHYTLSGDWVGFRARSVIGGYWMKILVDKYKGIKNNSNID